MMYSTSIASIALFSSFILGPSSSSILRFEPTSPEILDSALGLNGKDLATESLRIVEETLKNSELNEKSDNLLYRDEQVHQDYNQTLVAESHGNLRGLDVSAAPVNVVKLQRLMMNETLIINNGTKSLAAAAALPAGFQLPYNGGPVIPNVQVITIWWGSNVRFTSALESYYSTITRSSWQQIFAEYSGIGLGRWLKSYAYTSAPTGTVWDSKIQADLSALIQKGAVPPPSQNTYYAIHFAPGITIKIGSDTSCSTFCAYHSAFKYGSVKVAYGVMPDPCNGGCGQSSSAFNNLCSVSSHELAEAITDPAWPPAWYHQSQGEVADICNHQQATLGSYVVQKQWSNKAGACISVAQGGFPVSVPAPAPTKPVPTPVAVKPVPVPAPAPKPSPVNQPTCSGNMGITIFTDQKGYETWFYVVDMTLSSSPYYTYVWQMASQTLSSNTQYSVSKCFDPSHCYIVVMADKGGDGLCCSYGSGWYEIYWKGSRVKRSSFKGVTYEGTKIGNC